MINTENLPALLKTLEFKTKGKRQVWSNGATEVCVVPDPVKVVPQFLCLMMSSEAFRAEARGQAVKSAGQININATKMRNIKVPAPHLAEQKRFVAKVQKLEQQIAAAQAVIAAAPARKQAILQRYL